ncbi:hypothetical protein PSACC_01202 [Paramicrosporidium saccamoebae]|uniref:Uncharacterized protein n=1 Tax=Paramicrosporidium saccamoebae TaxID=1246581 RepID=A0A2H9TMP2_9FUNG|nr:hypothetical protein PSACC_01202 [Paramicrosporidium saccamoebae]
MSLAGSSTDLPKFLTWALVGQITSKESMQKMEELHIHCGIFVKELIMKFPLYEQLLQSLDPADCKNDGKVARQLVVGLIPELNGNYFEVANAIPDNEYVSIVRHFLRDSDYLCAADGRCKDLNDYVEYLREKMDESFRVTIGAAEEFLNGLLTSYGVPTEQFDGAKASISHVCLAPKGIIINPLEACIKEILKYKKAGDANKKPGGTPPAKPPATTPKPPPAVTKAYWDDKLSQDFKDLLRGKPFWTDEAADKAKTASVAPDYVKSDGTSAGLGEDDKVVLTYLLNNLPNDPDARKGIAEVASKAYIKSLGVKMDNVSGSGTISAEIFDRVKGMQGCPIEQRIRILMFKNVDLAKEIIPGQNRVSVERFLAWVYGCTTEEGVAKIMNHWNEEKTKRFIKHFPFIDYLRSKFYVAKLNQSKSIVEGFFHEHDNKSYEKVIEAIPVSELDVIVDNFYKGMPEFCTKESGCEPIAQYFGKLIDHMIQVVNNRICIFMMRTLTANDFISALPISLAKRNSLYGPIGISCDSDNKVLDVIAKALASP